MPRKPDTPCARCGKLLWSGSTSLPAGQRTCRPCRAPAKLGQPATPRRLACAVCSAEIVTLQPHQRHCSAKCRYADRGFTTDRGYGKRHRRERDSWAPHVEAGETRCAKCNWAIEPGQAWDLGHTDDRTAWTGPEHTRCNRSSARRATGPVYAVDALPRDRTCPMCGADYRATHRMQRTCGRACAVEQRRRDRHAKDEARKSAKPQRPTAACTECGAAFVMRHGRHLTCGPQCGRARTLRLLADRYRDEPEFRRKALDSARERSRRHRTSTSLVAHWPRRSCLHCEVEYQPLTRNQTYCSRRCGRIAGKRRARRRAAGARTVQSGHAA